MLTYFDPITLDNAVVDNTVIFYLIKTKDQYYIKGLSSGLDTLPNEPHTGASEYWLLDTKKFLQSVLTYAEKEKLFFPNEELTKQSFSAIEIDNHFEFNPDMRLPDHFNQDIRDNLVQNWIDNIMEDEQAAARGRWQNNVMNLLQAVIQASNENDVQAILHKSTELIDYLSDDQEEPLNVDFSWINEEQINHLIALLKHSNTSISLKSLTIFSQLLNFGVNPDVFYTDDLILSILNILANRASAKQPSHYREDQHQIEKNINKKALKILILLGEIHDIRSARDHNVLLSNKTITLSMLIALFYHAKTDIKKQAAATLIECKNLFCEYYGQYNPNYIINIHDVHQAGGIAAITALLNDSDFDVRNTGLELFQYYFVNDEDGKDLFRENNGVMALISLLNTQTELFPKNSADLTNDFYNILLIWADLGHFCRIRRMGQSTPDVQTQNIIRNAHGLQSLVNQLIELNRIDPCAAKVSIDIRLSLYNSLRYILLNNAASHNVFHQAGGIPLLVASLNHDDKLITCATKILADISQNSKNAMREANAIPPLIQLLRESENKDIQHNVLATLANLSFANPANRDLIYEADIILLLIQFLYHDVKNIKENAKQILHNLSAYKSPPAMPSDAETMQFLKNIKFADHVNQLIKKTLKRFNSSENDTQNWQQYEKYQIASTLLIKLLEAKSIFLLADDAFEEKKGVFKEQCISAINAAQSTPSNHFNRLLLFARSESCFDALVHRMAEMFNSEIAAPHIRLH